MITKPCIFALFLCLTGFSNGQTTAEGEGSELVITGGVVFRELAPPADGKRPLIAVGTEAGAHHLYDPNQLAMQGFWNGVFGRVDKEGVFTPSNKSMNSFHMEKTPPWSYGEKPRRQLTHEWLGHELRDGMVCFLYRLHDKTSAMSWEIVERLEVHSDQRQQIHFEITPSAKADLYLNYWVTQTAFRSLVTDGQQNQRNKIKNLHPDQRKFTITFLRRKQTLTVPHGYTIETIAIPENNDPPFLFEPTAIDFAKDGTAFVSNRTGSVWRRTKDGTWNRFAEGLHEVNGVQVTPDGKGVYVMQKPELTLLRDTDGDGSADLYQTIEDRYRFTGQYHEFAYGPRMNAKGELFFSTGLASRGYHPVTTSNPNQMTTPLGYRGWVMRRNPDGTLTPFAAGLRSPAGIGMNAKDELFITDNQGDWVASSYLGHVEEGDFLGHPASLWDRKLTPKTLDYTNNEPMPKTVPPLDKATFAPSRKRPAVWLSHGDLTNSPGHPSFAPEHGFGPFGGQAFIADIAHRNIVRVALEKVGGKYQGAVFPFIRPLSSASYSTRFDPQGNLWVGSVGRGWISGDPAIEVIRYDDGATPFEMHHIALTKTGFSIAFTEALAEDQNITASDISITAFRYEYWDEYGSERKEVATTAPTKATLSADRKTLSLTLPLRAEYVYEIQLPACSSASGASLENNYGIYTLNQLLP